MRQMPCVLWVDRGPFDCAARVQPARERRNLGNEDLLIDGTGRRTDPAHERKAYRRGPAKVTADIIAREVWCTAREGQSSRKKTGIEIKKMVR